MQNKNTILLIILVILVAICAWFLMKNNKTEQYDVSGLTPSPKLNTVDDSKPAPVGQPKPSVQPPQNNTQNPTTKTVNYGFTFSYPKSWKFSDHSKVSTYFAIDPMKVFSSQELQGVDMPAGLITFSAEAIKNSFVVGYNDMPTVYIGKDNKIKAKKFEKFYAKDAPEVSVQGNHTITYYIGEDKQVQYWGYYNDAYLNDFNSIINSLEL